MNIRSLDIPEVKLIEPKVFGDHRGFFVETWQEQRYREAGIALPFVQDNVSKSRRGILRGLHVQHPHGQGKLVRCGLGEVFDVAVDLRLGSPTFGKWAGALLNDTNHHQLWIPPGFAHGFLVLSEVALFAYKCTDTYHPETEFSLRFDDPAVGIEWPDAGELVLSDKDRDAPLLSEIPEDRLPRYEAP